MILLKYLETLRKFFLVLVQNLLLFEYASSAPKNTVCNFTQKIIFVRNQFLILLCSAFTKENWKTYFSHFSTYQPIRNQKKKKRNSLHVFLCILLRRTHSESFGKRQWTLHDLELLRTFISLTKKPCFWQTVSLCQICKKTFALQNQKTNNQIMETLYLNKKKSFQGFFIP